MENLSRAVLILFLFLSVFPAQASVSLDVVINEIAWMGTENSYNDEWIELYNNATYQINLFDWQLTGQDGVPKIKLAGIIPANGFYLLERASDNTVPDIPADQIFSGALANSGETLVLYDTSGILIDSVDCSSGWFGGNNSTKQTMERKNPLLAATNAENWSSSREPGGTPKSINSFAETIQTEGQTENKPPLTFTESDLPSYPTGIFINEILPSPEGPDETEEWIELFNQNVFEVDLAGWRIKDSTGKSAVYTFPDGTKILSQGFLLFRRPTTKIVLNNDGDEVSLLRPDGEITDSVPYETSLLGQSYNKTDSGWAWSDNLTPGATNETPAILSSLSPEGESLSSGQKKEIQVKRSVAAAGKQIAENSFVSSIAAILSIFSGAIILFLKMKLKQA